MAVISLQLGLWPLHTIKCSATILTVEQCACGQYKNCTCNGSHSSGLAQGCMVMSISPQLCRIHLLVHVMWSTDVKPPTAGSLPSHCWGGSCPAYSPTPPPNWWVWLIPESNHLWSLPPQLRKRSVWLTATGWRAASVRGMWRSTTVGSGAPCATTSGLWRTQRWCVGWPALPASCGRTRRATTVREWGGCGWTTSTARARRPCWTTAHTMRGARSTRAALITLWTLGSCALTVSLPRHWTLSLPLLPLQGSSFSLPPSSLSLSLPPPSLPPSLPPTLPPSHSPSLLPSLHPSLPPLSLKTWPCD